MRNTWKNWMLGTALIAGFVGTGAETAFAAPREFHGPEGREPGREVARGYDRGYNRGFERPVVRGYGERGYGFAQGGPVVEGYIPPCPGEGYVWLNGAWIFRGRPGFVRGYGYGREARFDRGYDRGGRGFDRGFRGRR